VALSEAVMQTLQTFQVIAAETLRALLAAWPLSLVAFGVAAVGFVIGGGANSIRWPARRVLISAIYVLPLVVMLIGALLAYDGPRATMYEPPRAWKGLVLWLPVLSGVVCVAALAIRTPGARLRSLALAAPAVWLTLCATIVAGMAIAGVGA
jgi:hypothetical protein